MRASRDSTVPTTLPIPADAPVASAARLVDPWIVGALVVLLAIGTVMVYSASAVRMSARDGSSSFYLVRHLGSIAIGFVCAIVAVRTPLERWSRVAYPLLVVSIALLALVFVPGLGKRVNGAVRWLSLGPISFQPGEIAKLAVVVYLAHSLAKKRQRVTSFSVGFLPHAIVTGLVASLIIVQPDLGTAAVIAAVVGLMLFIAGTRIAYLVLAVVLAIPVAYHYVATHAHAAARLLAFADPEGNKMGIGYQIWESLVAFGSGGPLGLGLGGGREKLHFLPESHTDFIFAVVGQELGFVGAVIVVLAFLVIVGRGLYTAATLPCRFPMFLAFGVSCWIGIQAFTNMAVVVALLPTKGLTLPFVSYGRTSTIVGMIAIGILLRATAERRLAMSASSTFARRAAGKKRAWFAWARPEVSR